MAKVNMFKMSLKNYNDKYSQYEDFKKEDGVKSIFEDIIKILIAIADSNKNDSQKINDLMEYYNFKKNDKKSEKFINLYNLIFDENIYKLSIEDIVDYVGYTNRIYKSKVSKICLNNCFVEENKMEKNEIKKIQEKIIKEEKERENKERENKEHIKEVEENKRITEMSISERIRFKFKKAVDKEAFATELYNELFSMESDEKNITAEFLFDFYNCKEKPSKKVKIKINNIKEIIGSKK